MRDFLVGVLVSRGPFGHAFLQRGAQTVESILEHVQAIPVVWMRDLSGSIDVVVMVVMVVRGDGCWRWDLSNYRMTGRANRWMN